MREQKKQANTSCESFDRQMENVLLTDFNEFLFIIYTDLLIIYIIYKDFSLRGYKSPGLQQLLFPVNK